jgi:hypothetical protein
VGSRVERPAERADNNSDVTDPARIEDEPGVRYGVGRLLTLPDGVFAIALTPLVLRLSVNVATPGSELGAALCDARPASRRPTRAWT